MKTIEIAIDSPAGRAVCNLADSLGLDPQDVFQGILFGICNRKKRKDISQAPSLVQSTSTLPATHRHLKRSSFHKQETYYSLTPTK